MVENMTVPQKLNALAECIAKCEDVEYSMHVAFGDNKEQKLSELRIIVQNGRKLFSSGQLENLDYDVRNEAIKKWHHDLDRELSMFPEYKKDLEEAPTRHM